MHAPVHTLQMSKSDLADEVNGPLGALRALESAEGGGGWGGRRHHLYQIICMHPPVPDAAITQ